MSAIDSDFPIQLRWITSALLETMSIFVPHHGAEIEAQVIFVDKFDVKWVENEAEHCFTDKFVITSVVAIESTQVHGIPNEVRKGMQRLVIVNIETIKFFVDSLGPWFHTEQ